MDMLREMKMIMQYKNIKIDNIKDIAIEAGKRIMEIYNGDFSIEYKKDLSPLTYADKESNKIICNNLEKLYPNIPIMSEENQEINYNTRKEWEYYWCIDPIDGTKEFIKKNDEFTVNIALIYKSRPVLGVVYAPALNELYYAKEGEGAYKNFNKLPLKVNSSPEKSLKVVASKSHLSIETQDFIDKLKSEQIEQVSRGSSLKLCMVATGEADIYPRLAPTMEWDIAASDIIVRESGKQIYQHSVNFDFEELRANDTVVYNKANLLNPWFIVI